MSSGLGNITIDTTGLKGLRLQDSDKGLFLLFAISCILFITGIVLYNLKAANKEDTESNKKTGKIMMSVGGGLIGLVILYNLYKKYKK